MKRYLIYVVSALVCVYASEPENGTGILISLAQITEKCGIEHNVEMSTVYSALEGGYLHHLDPCFLGCILERLGLINDKGYAEPDAVLSELKQLLLEPDYEIAATVLKQCSEKVNAESPKNICDSASVFTPCLDEAFYKVIGDKYTGVEYA